MTRTATILTGLLASLTILSAQSAPPGAQPPARPLRVIAFGAHPDDAELKASGVAALWAAEGAKVKFVAMTNGDVGHFAMAGGPKELPCSKCHGTVLCDVVHDGTRWTVVRIRRAGPSATAAEG